MDAEALDKLIDDALAYKSKRTKKREIGRYWPSEIKKCLRQSYLDYHGSVEVGELDLKTAGIFQSAIATQDKLVELIRNYVKDELKLENAVEAETEIKVDIGDGCYLSGRGDLLLLFPNDETLVEIKSVGWPKKLETLNEDHRYQLLPYLKYYGYEKGLFCYIDRGTLQHKSYTQYWDEKIWNECVWRIKEKNHYIKNKEYPPPEAMLTNSMKKQCDWCPWIEICADDWEKYGIESGA